MMSKARHELGGRARTCVRLYAGNRIARLKLVTHQVTQLTTEVGDRIRTANFISLFLDFDGTLVPIAPLPEYPRLDAGIARTLNLLSRQESLLTTIISGRAIEDLYARVRLERLIYAGNHGLEIFGRQLRFVEPLASARRGQLEALSEELLLALGSIPGAIVENKGLSASVHCRTATEEDRVEIQRVVYACAARYSALFHVNPGRKVFDIVPRTDWHKGRAVQWINQHLGESGQLDIYLGDDVSDEDAFCVLPEAITIRVGTSGETCARYRLPDPAAVHEFLVWLSASGFPPARRSGCRPSDKHCIP